VPSKRCVAPGTGWQPTVDERRRATHRDTRPRRGVRDGWGTVRVRTAAAAVILVGLVLAVSGVVMVVLLQRSLTADVRDAAILRVEAVADRVAETDRTDVTHAIPDVDEEEEFVQVLDADGTVVASSTNLAGRGPVARPEPGTPERVDGLPFDDETFLAVSVSASRLLVVVGRSLDRVTDSGEAVVGLVVFGIPLLLAVLGWVIWLVVGRTLAPVEAIRAEVEAISSRELHRRVPSP
jgi:hypothetical protein